MITAFLIIASTASLASATPAPPPQSTDSAAIAALIKDVERANNEADVELWVSAFANDFAYMATGSPAVTTRPELIEVARTGFRNKAAITIQLVEIRVAGNWAWSRSVVAGTVTLSGTGRVVNVDVKQLAIYSKGPDGAWRIARLMINSNR